MMKTLLYHESNAQNFGIVLGKLQYRMGLGFVDIKMADHVVLCVSTYFLLLYY